MHRELAFQQGWGQFVPILAERYKVSYIGATPGSLIHRRWRRLEPFVLKYYVPLSKTAKTYFAWGDDIVLKLIPSKRYYATIHQPPAKWPKELASWAEAMGGIHVLSDEDRVALSKIAPKATVRTILHGIHTDFWTPAESAPETPRIVFTGKYMRNFKMFRRVVEQLKLLMPELECTMLLNPGFQPEEPLPGWIKRAGMLHATELRALYQSGTIMFMPYDNVTASNSICEALSCGVPIVTTRVGGMPSYAKGGGMVLVENNDDEAALKACLQVLSDPALRASLSREARANACRSMDWHHFAKHKGAFLTGS